MGEFDREESKHRRAYPLVYQCRTKRTVLARLVVLLSSEDSLQFHDSLLGKCLGFPDNEDILLTEKMVHFENIKVISRTYECLSSILAVSHIRYCFCCM